MFDLLIVGRKSHEVSLKEAAIWTAIWDYAPLFFIRIKVVDRFYLLKVGVAFLLLIPVCNTGRYNKFHNLCRWNVYFYNQMSGY